MTRSDVICLIPAAGQSVRFGQDVPKQYSMLQGSSILRRTCLAFLQHPGVDGVCVIYNPADQALYDEAVGDLDLLPPVIGGNTRQASVRKGLESLITLGPSKVLIHDAARPLVSERIIQRVVDALNAHAGVVPAVAVEDTIKRCADGAVVDTVDREDLQRAQTPQGFQYPAVLDAHHKLEDTAVTDDASLYEHLGIAVTTVEGSPLNFKITTADDLERAERFLGHTEIYDTCVGSGFDVHRLVAHDAHSNGTIRLCGVDIEHSHALAGHSDADVGMHALVDALLGTVGEGDIGRHFSDTADENRDRDSAEFLAYAVALVGQHGGRLVHVDVTLICEQPKIGPHVEKMRQKLSDILAIDYTRVNVKATTTEGLGFTGRGEGIAAQAVASVLLPRKGL